jgi:hypothetical protein
MDEESKSVLKIIGFEFDELKDVEGSIIPREVLLSDNKYDEVKKLIPELKKNYSSSFMTSLQKNADKSQKFPLINIVRQILNVYDYKMEPIRKSDGYTLEGVKKYKRYFQIKKKHNTNEFNNDNEFDKNDDIKKIEFDNTLEIESIVKKEDV